MTCRDSEESLAAAVSSRRARRRPAESRVPKSSVLSLRPSGRIFTYGIFASRRIASSCRLTTSDGRMPVSATTYKTKRASSFRAVERAVRQQLCLDEFGFERHARAFGLAFEAKAFEDVRQVEPAANADFLQHSAQLADILVGGFDLDVVVDDAIAPPFAVVDARRRRSAR